MGLIVGGLSYLIIASLTKVVKKQVAAQDALLEPISA